MAWRPKIARGKEADADADCICCGQGGGNKCVALFGTDVIDGSTGTTRRE
jgi:hypothetical protein